MNTKVATASKVSNLAVNAPFQERNGVGQLILSINALLREKFGRKTWASVAFLLKLEDRTARHRLAGTRPYDFADLVNLIRSELGFLILKILMGPDKKRWPAWFKVCERAMRRKKLIDDVEQFRLEIEEEKIPGV
jgi:hypothetical protein